MRWPMKSYWSELRRSPHGERGLKLSDGLKLVVTPSGRSPHGERGLKYPQIYIADDALGRSPHGERGLKLRLLGRTSTRFMRSLPSRGAWIEILSLLNPSFSSLVAPLTGSVD